MPMREGFKGDAIETSSLLKLVPYGPKIFQDKVGSIIGVAKFLDSSGHLSKLEIFCEPHLNTYLGSTQKNIKIFYRDYIY